MRAVLFEGVGSPLRPARVAGARAGPGPGAAARPRVRRLPDRPAPARRRGRRSPPRRGSSVIRSSAGSERDGPRVGVPWLGWTCGECAYCRSGRENLCRRARFTGRDIDGGFAEYAVADERFCFPIPDGYPDEQAAPLLCAGLIGYRCLRMCGDARRARPLRLRRSGAHPHAGRARPGPRGLRVHARRATTSPRPSPASSARRGPARRDARPPEQLDAAIIFAPVGALVPLALRRPSRPAARSCAAAST